MASQVEVHDKYQFDIKITYPLVSTSASEAPEVNYAVDVFLFLPKNFHVSQTSYQPSRLFEDIQAFLRLDPPELGIHELRDAKSPDSPLHWLEEALLLRARGERLPRVAEILEKAQILGCTVVQIIRDRERLARQTRTAIQAFEPILVLLADFRRIIRLYEYHEVDVGVAALRELRLVDEWISLALEEAMAGASRDTHLGKEDRAFLATTAAHEIRYRRRAGYYCITSATHSGDEYFLYRRGQLKKHIQQVLFLDVRAEATSSSIQQIIAAFGAALAAAWWFVAQTSAAAGSSTFVLFAVGVLAYILKDRIKEVTRTQLSERLRRYMPDRTSTIRGSFYGLKMKGACREAVRYTKLEELPGSVLLARDLHHVVDLGDDPLEEVLHYRKQITFSGELVQTMQRSGARDTRVRDIVRLGIRDFTEHLDDPKRVVTFFDPDVGDFVSRLAPKIYHLNLVLRYERLAGSTSRQTVTGDVSFERVRAILNRKGISRVDIVLPRTPESALAESIAEVP